MITRNKQRQKRHKRIRGKIKGTKDIPRLCVFRSNSHIYAQIIDDENNKVLASAGDFKIKDKKMTKTELAEKVGALIAKEAVVKKIKKVVFDRGGYKYHGRVKALAEEARKGGLVF